MPAPHHSVFYRPDALPAAQPTASKKAELHELVTHLLLYEHFSGPGSAIGLVYVSISLRSLKQNQTLT